MEWFASICPALANANWWDLVPATVGALVGAAAAAIPAFFLARNASRETLRRDQESRLERQKNATLRGLATLVRIVNGIENIHRHIEELIKESENANPTGMELWQRILPIVGIEKDEWYFETEDVAIFVSAKKFDFFNDILLLSHRYTSLKIALQYYGDSRSRLTDELPSQMEGQIGHAYLSPAEMDRFRPRAVQLETLAVQIRTTARDDWDFAKKVASQFGPIAREYFKDSSFPTLSIGQRIPATTSTQTLS